MSLFLCCVFLYPVSTYLRMVGIRQGGCWAHTTLLQFLASLSSSVVVHKALSTTHKIARMNTAVVAMAHESAASAAEPTAGARPARLHCVVRYLSPKMIDFAAVASFMVCMCLWFANPHNIDMMHGRGEPAQCTGWASSVAIFAWYIAIIPYFTVRSTHVLDIAVLDRLKYVKIEMIFLSVIIAAFFVARLVGPRNNSNRVTLVNLYLALPFVAAFAWFESGLPLWLMLKVKATAPRLDGMPSLSVVLAEPTLLQAFHDHLIAEFSLENLVFYKAVIVYERRSKAQKVDARRIRKGSASSPAATTSPRARAKRESSIARALFSIERQAFDIYKCFISEGGTQQVNLSASVTQNLQRFFSQEPYASWDRIASATARDDCDSSAHTRRAASDEFKFVEIRDHNRRTPAVHSFIQSHPSVYGGDSKSDAGAKASVGIKLTGGNKSARTGTTWSAAAMPARPPPPQTQLHGSDSPQSTRSQFKVRDSSFWTSVLEEKRWASVLRFSQSTESLFDVLHVFERAKRETYNLMARDSYTRFLTKPGVPQLISRRLGLMIV